MLNLPTKIAFQCICLPLRCSTFCTNMDDHLEFESIWLHYPLTEKRIEENQLPLKTRVDRCFQYLCRISGAIYIPCCHSEILPVLLVYLTHFYILGGATPSSHSLRKHWAWNKWKAKRQEWISLTELTTFWKITLALAWRYSSLQSLFIAMSAAVISLVGSRMLSHQGLKK
jgi:hypothetical protein